MNIIKIVLSYLHFSYKPFTLLRGKYDDLTKLININTDGKEYPIISKQNSINHHFNRYLKSYDNSITSQIVSLASAPGKLYTTIKVHKQSNSAQPTVSMINCQNITWPNFFIKSLNHTLHINSCWTRRFTC